MQPQPLLAQHVSLGFKRKEKEKEKEKGEIKEGEKCSSDEQDQPKIWKEKCKRSVLYVYENG